MAEKEKGRGEGGTQPWYGRAGGGGFAYILGMVGAAVYYVQHAVSFGSGVIGLLKALVWPAFLVYHLLGLR